MVAGIAPFTPGSRGPDFQARWKAALETVPADERALKQKILDACSDIESKISHIQRDLRDCNVILARTVGRCIEFEMKSDG